MSIFKIELKNITELRKADGSVNRYPPVGELKKFLVMYMESGQGIVILHDSFYDYQYDTKLSSYHKVDSHNVIGHMLDVIVENDDKLYLIVEFNDTFNPEKDYICFYRANLESDPREQERTLKITNLFAIDLITIVESEKEAITSRSSFEPYFISRET